MPSTTDRNPGAATAHAATDFGGLVHHIPAAVARPRDADLESVILDAAARGWKIATRGRGHTVYGASQVADGLVVDMADVDEWRVLGEDAIEVGAGATWRAVLGATLPLGLTPPVLTNYLDLSVGGTLAVGGIGGASCRSGAQTDHVLELEVVTGDGRRLRCSRELRPDLFAATLGGQGQAAIVTSAVLRLVPAPLVVRAYIGRYAGVRDLVADQRRALDSSLVDTMQGNILPTSESGWSYELEVASFSNEHDDAIAACLSGAIEPVDVQERSYLEHVTAFDEYERALRSSGAWSHAHPWLLTFLPDAAVEPVVTSIVDGLRPDDLGDLGRILLTALDRKGFETPLLRLPEATRVFALNLIRFSPTVELGEQLVVRNRAVYDQVRAAGGLLYAPSALRLAPSEWREHFGSRWPAFARAIADHDPERLLNPGPGIVVDSTGAGCASCR